LDRAVPASKIAALSSGEFVDMAGDTPKEKMGLKMFHAALTQPRGFESLSRQSKELAQFQKVSLDMIQENFHRLD
jgi:hypothetical protein